MRFFTFLQESNQRVTKKDLDRLESGVDALFSKLNIDVEFTKHFFQRLNDVRNRRQITYKELQDMFRDTYRKHGKKISTLGPDAEAVIKDMRSDINVPFVLNGDSKSQEFDLVLKTIMRKKNFRTTSPELVIQ